MKLTKLTKNDFEWFDRIGVNEERMDIIRENQEKLDKIDEVSDLFKFTPTYIIKKILKGEHVCNDFSCNSEDEHEKLDDTLETVESKLPQTRKVIKDGFDFRK